MNRSSTRDIWQPIAAGYMWEHLKQTEPRMSDSCSTGFIVLSALPCTCCAASALQKDL